MTIQEMLEREDIYTILSKTLEVYFKSVLNKDVIVKVEKSVFKNRYVIYPRLGVVVSRCPSWSVMNNIYTQFNVQGSWKRKLLAWGYITLCFLSFGLLADRSLYVSDKKWCKRDRFIMPCNRKIRIFDYGEKYVDAIIKEGFNDTYFKNELKFRVTTQYSFIPPFIQYGNKWYRENLLTGRALVRLSEPQYTTAIEKTKEEISKLYRDTLHFEDAITYCKRLDSYIREKLPLLNEAKGLSTEYTEVVLSKVSVYIKGVNIQIPLVTSHGDLQTGNIKMEGPDKVTIYDWETAGERSIWYDMGKLLLYSQRKGRYSYMIEHINDKEIKDRLLSFDNKEYPMLVVASILILEELVFFIDEILDLPGSMGSEIMDRLTSELKLTKAFN